MGSSLKFLFRPLQQEVPPSAPGSGDAAAHHHLSLAPTLFSVASLGGQHFFHFLPKKETEEVNSPFGICSNEISFILCEYLPNNCMDLYSLFHVT